MIFINQSTAIRLLAALFVIPLAAYLALNNFHTSSISKTILTVLATCLFLILLLIICKKKRGELISYYAGLWLEFYVACFLFLLTSLVFRIWSLYRTQYNLDFEGFLSSTFITDLYAFSYFLPIFVCYQLYRLLLFAGNTIHEKTKPTFVISFTLSTLMIAGFLWGWLPASHRFSSLEVIYTLKTPGIHYDFSYAFLAIILGILILGAQKYIAKFISTRLTNVNFLSLIHPFVVIGICVFIGYAKQVDHHKHLLDEETPLYISNYNHHLANTALLHNPFSHFIEQGLKECLRIKSFGWHKQMLPFFERPNLQFTIQEQSNHLAVSLAADETIPYPQYPALRVKKGRKAFKKFNIVIIVLETLETDQSDSFKAYENPYKFLDEFKKSSLQFEHCFANSECSYEGESAISSALPIWGVMNASQSGLLATSYNKGYLTVLKGHGYNSEFSPTWNATTSLLKSVPVLRRFFEAIFSLIGYGDNSLTFKMDHYTLPFLMAGIQKISPLFDQHLNKAALDPDIHQGDEYAEQEFDGKVHGTWYVHDDYGYEKLYNKIDAAQEPFFIVTHTSSSHKCAPIPRGHRPEHSLAYAERFYYSHKYADSALKRFFEKVKQHPDIKIRSLSWCPTIRQLMDIYVFMIAIIFRCSSMLLIL